MEDLAHDISIKNPLAKVFFVWTVFKLTLSTVNICLLTIILSTSVCLISASHRCILPPSILIKLIKVKSYSVDL